MKRELLWYFFYENGNQQPFKTNEETEFYGEQFGVVPNANTVIDSRK